MPHALSSQEGAPVPGAPALQTRGAIDEQNDDLWLGGACTLDHDGCVTCADAGIPVRVVLLDGDDALCQDVGGNRAHIAVELVAPVEIGDILLAHGGVAIGRVGRAESGGEKRA